MTMSRSFQSVSRETAPLRRWIGVLILMPLAGGPFGGRLLAQGEAALVPGWPFEIGPVAHSFIPIVANVYGDAAPEIVVPSGNPLEGPRAYLTNGQLVPNWTSPVEGSARMFAGNLVPGPHQSAVHTSGAGIDVFFALGPDGSVLPGWPALDAANGVSELSMALGDLDGDGLDELVYVEAVNPDLTIHVLGSDGQVQPGWPVSLTWPPNVGNPISFIDTGLAVGDVDLDGRAEIVVVFWGVPFSGPNYTEPSVWLLDGNGSVRPGWPLQPHPGGEVFTPVIADLDQDHQPEIVLPGYYRLHAYRPDGIKRFETAAPSVTYPYPAVADLDADGWLEVVLAGDLLRVAKVHQYSVVTSGFVVAKEVSDVLPYRNYKPPVVGDVDGDGQLEIVVWSIYRIDLPLEDAWTLHVLNSATLEPLPGWPKAFPPGVVAPYRELLVPALADLDGDGDMEIIHTWNHEIFAWDQPAIGTQGQPAPWPQFCHDGSSGGSFHRGNEPVPMFVRGDANGDLRVDVADVPFLLGHLYLGTTVSCAAAVDIDEDATTGLADVLLLLATLFESSFVPPPPYPDCGSHPGVGLLQCHRFTCP